MLNNSLEVGICLCSFSFGTDRCYAFQVPDENDGGYVIGYIFMFNCSPYFYSIAQGSEGLNTYMANTYAQYLADNKEYDLLEKVPGEDDVWRLNDEMTCVFDDTFTDAMLDAGFVPRRDGGWKYKRKRKAR